MAQPRGRRERAAASPALLRSARCEGVWRSADVRARFVHLVREGTARVAAAARHGQKAGTIRRDVDAEALAFSLAASRSV